jgi:hypothetical protein
LGFFNEKEDVLWLRETCLKGIEVPEFKSFILFGNEDDPDKVELYEGVDPLYDDKPVYTFKRGN